MYLEDESIDVKKLKYALYARKSTEDKARQVRSIGDQITECVEKANRLGIKISKPYLKETKSAKKPGQRPVFSQMLKDLRNKKYDGIITWHPDRISRNMIESGEIIDMLDDNIIKDIKFVTHDFTNDPNGKMMLGMMFVFSKHFSDDLSTKVNRGVSRALSEGKSSGTPKHGYLRSEDGIYRPEGNNFELIKNAWMLRIEKASFSEIIKYLNDNNYTKSTIKSNRKIAMSPQMLSVMFRDPFYYGILIQKEQQVDLRLIYDFKPMISEKEYYQVQDLSKTRSTGYQTKRRSAFYPLKGLVYCNTCDKKCYVAPSRGRYKRYLYYRCDNKLCPQKAVRGKVIFDFIYHFLDEGLNLTKNEYKEYCNDLKNISESKSFEIKTQIHNKSGRLKHIESNIRERSLKIVDIDQNSTIRKINEDEIANQEEIAETLKDEILELKEQLTPYDKNIMSIENFLNLSKNASAKVKAGDAIQKDAICRLIFLNLKIGDQKVVSYSLKEPFATLLKNRNIITGRGEAINLEPLSQLANSIVQYWTPTDITTLVKADKQEYNLVYEY